MDNPLCSPCDAVQVSLREKFTYLMVAPQQQQPEGEHCLHVHGFLRCECRIVCFLDVGRFCVSMVVLACSHRSMTDETRKIAGADAGGAIAAAREESG